MANVGEREEKTGIKGLNSNQLKMIAITAMTIDHVTSVVFPGYSKVWWILVLHIIGRLAAPILWFCIAVMAILQIGWNQGDFKRQMTGMMTFVAMYAIIYAIFIDPVYGILQLFTALTIPLLKSYNGKRGNWKGMKWFFYAYYPLHLVVCGLIRVTLHGNIGVIIGG